MKLTKFMVKCSIIRVGQNHMFVYIHHSLTVKLTKFMVKCSVIRVGQKHMFVYIHHSLTMKLVVFTACVVFLFFSFVDGAVSQIGK